MVEQGANVNANNDLAFMLEMQYGMNKGLDIVKYLIKNGTNIHVNNYKALKFATWKSSNESYKWLEIIEYLINNNSYPTEPMEIPSELQDRVIENSLSSLNFITNLRPDLKEFRIVRNWIIIK